MVGMAQKQWTRRDRILSLCLWGSLLAFCLFDVLHRHDARFLTLFTMATALMAIVHESLRA